MTLKNMILYYNRWLWKYMNVLLILGTLIYEVANWCWMMTSYLKLWGAVCLNYFFHFLRTNFAPIWHTCCDMAYCNNMWHIYCDMTYCNNMWHIYCDMTYCNNMWHIYCDMTYCSNMWHIHCDMTYCSNMWHIHCDMTYCSNKWHIYRTREQLAPLGSFLLADLFRYHNNVMCFESHEREYILAPFLLAIRLFSRHFNHWNQCRMKSSTATCSWY